MLPSPLEGGRAGDGVEAHSVLTPLRRRRCLPAPMLKTVPPPPPNPPPSRGRANDSEGVHNRAVNQAYSAPLNQTINWSNPESGHSGSVTPVREGVNSSTGGVCRQYRQTIVVDGQAETAYGTACKNPDGTWSLAN